MRRILRDARQPRYGSLVCNLPTAVLEDVRAAGTAVIYWSERGSCAAGARRERVTTKEKAHG